VAAKFRAYRPLVFLGRPKLSLDWILLALWDLMGFEPGPFVLLSVGRRSQNLGSRAFGRCEDEALKKVRVSDRTANGEAWNDA
jgi:hypothetical protein